MRFLHSASDRRNDSEVEWQRCHFCIFSQPLFVFMKALTLRHVPNCHFERSRSAANRKASYWAGYRPTSADLEVLCRISTESRNLLLPCSPLYWPHIIERNVGSFPRWQSCIGLPSRAKLALSLPIKGLFLCLPDRNGAGR